MIRVDTISEVIDRHGKACKKHSWAGYSAPDMLIACLGEQKELLQAMQRGRISGKHGVVDESFDVMATHLRLAEALEHKPIDMPFVPDLRPLISEIDATIERMRRNLQKC